MKKQIKKDSSILIFIVSSITILMLICYLGIRNVGDTYSVSTTKCSAGYYYIGQGKCSICLANHYCEGGEFANSETSHAGINECPNGTSSPEGSDSETDCTGVTVCKAGTYYYGQGICRTCPANYYCPGVTSSTGDSSRAGINECPNGKSSPEGSDSETDCTSITVCKAGTYYSGQGKCSTCPANYYCPGVTNSTGDSSRAGINECPNNGKSPEGSDSETDCTSVTVCKAGTYYSGQGKCSTCPANYYCPGVTSSAGDSSRAGINECPNGKLSPEGSDSEKDCTSTGNGSEDNSDNDSDSPNTPIKPGEDTSNTPNQNITENPKTGSIAIFLVWIIGIGMAIYSFVYFKESRIE